VMVLAFPISYFPIWCTTNIFFLGWVKKLSMWSSGGDM
jgi:hypothetical protein